MHTLRQSRIIVIEVLWWLGMESLHRAGTLIEVLHRVGTLMFMFSSFFLFSLPNGRLCYGEARAETVTSFRPYDLVDRPSNAYICQPNAYTYRPIDRSNDDPSTDRTSLYRTLAPYCYLNSPFWWILSHVYCKERNRLILRLVLCTGCEERPRLILSRTSCEERNYQDYPRWHHSATDYRLCRSAYSPIDLQ